MPRFVVDKRAINVTIRNFRGSRQRMRRAQEVAIALAGSRMTAAIKANVTIPPIGGSARTHRNALARLGHPYATRYPAIQIKPSGGVPGFAKPELKVHTVSGQLASAISGSFDRSSLTYEVKADTARAPHLRYVIQGTRVMLPRDILWETASSPQVRKAMLKAIVLVLGRVFRTQAQIRFK